jgi:hypothetical protein
LIIRLLRVMFTPKWRDGRPSRLPTAEEVERTPRVVKVLRIESYEDALHNLATEETLAREAPRADAHRKTVGEDAYRLRYLARLPLEASASLLHLDRLEHPFRYTIEVLTDQGPRERTVDLIETFNLVYGLHVERRERWTNPEDPEAALPRRPRPRPGRQTGPRPLARRGRARSRPRAPVARAAPRRDGALGRGALQRRLRDAGRAVPRPGLQASDRRGGAVKQTGWAVEVMSIARHGRKR